MTSHTPPTTTPDAKKTPLWMAAEANASGQIANLEPNAQYFVVRRPTPDLTKERSKEFVEDVRGFLHDQRVLAERQMKELQERYGEPAKARVQEVRSTLERRFDELAKEIETRVEKIEHELGERGILKNRKDEMPITTHVPGETPGEMPTGGNGADHPASMSPGAAPKKKAAKKEE